MLLIMKNGSIIWSILLHEKRVKVENTTLPKMGLSLLKRVSLLFLVSASVLLSTCLAGRDSKLFNEFAKEANAINHVEGIPQKPSRHSEEESIQERLLRVNTRDYGRYDPAPALVKPPFKLIPN